MLNRRNVVVFAILNTVMIVVLLSQIWRLAKEIKEYESILADSQEKRLKNEGICLRENFLFGRNS